MKRLLLLLAIFAVCIGARPASAQTIGTFRWNIAPFCNVLNLTVTQQGESFALVGFEESCAGNPRVPVNGTAIIQADGTITLAVTSVFPTGDAMHTSVTLDTTLGGTWRDDAANTGTFVFNPTTATGEPRMPATNTPTDRPTAPPSSGLPGAPFSTSRPPR
jgi:hypothetical protein